jgi:uncharacterized protein YuzE
MSVEYDKETDSLSIKFRKAEIEETDEVAPGFLADLDELGQMVSLEILNASHRIDSLDTIVINSRKVVVG